LGDATREEFEDATGCVPLLLDGCIVDGRLDMSALVLINIEDQVQAFIETRWDASSLWNRLVLFLSIQTSPNCCRYVEYMNACIFGTHLAAGAYRSLSLLHKKATINEVSTSDGAYTCGVARNAIAHMLRKFINSHGRVAYLRSLPEYIDNPVVTGFFVKQAVLWSISARGLNIGQQIEGGYRWLCFRANSHFIH